MSDNEKIEILTIDEMDARYRGSSAYKAGRDAANALSDDALLDLVDSPDDTGLVVSYSEEGQTLTLETSAETVEVIHVSDETARVIGKLSGSFVRFLKS